MTKRVVRSWWWSWTKVDGEDEELVSRGKDWIICRRLVAGTGSLAELCVCVCVCVLLEVEGVVDDVGDWWSSGRLRSRRRGGGKLCMLLQSCTALPALVVAKCGRRMRQMPMTTKDPRRVRHWRHRSTGGRGRCDVPPHSLLRRGYKSWLYLSQTGLTHPHGQGTRVGPSCWGQKAAICTMPCAR